MIRFVVILSVFVLAIQAKPSENEYYRLLEDLLERNVQTCRVNEMYLNCDYQEQCQGETCPGDKYCCASKCGKICMCHPIPQNCGRHCPNGYQLGNNGCYICECNAKRSFKQFLTRLLQKDEQKEEIDVIDDERKDLSVSSSEKYRK
ncbi:uncharacterized protein LOC127721506 isoform X2 [Mytilus californianus]|uniref:uncharacterized protein LOC127721506 isoform X1 n=1 Tax=Mytilus californianus TaxID=6549 RepID=UPI002246132F|nr:uncharacterized protein LOC127721506 isoform X1 [Mytilus californianus]XP_052084233.1 uncharacterized protein LOC127721506 isoform X2 [Mytilus californianus]